MTYTNEEYWDCECETRYVHLKKYVQCGDCFAMRDEQPDSISDEIIGINMASGKGLVVVAKD